MGHGWYNVYVNMGERPMGAEKDDGCLGDLGKC
jgi:hypothetical protein